MCGKSAQSGNGFSAAPGEARGSIERFAAGRDLRGGAVLHRLRPRLKRDHPIGDTIPVVAAAENLSPARRVFLHIFRWFALGIGVFAVVGPLQSMRGVYQHYSGRSLTQADILESTLRRSGTRGMGAEYDLYVRYRVGDRLVRHNVRVTSNAFRPPRRGGKIDLFVDPKSFEAEDDLRLDSWIMVILGAAAAAVLVGGFVGIGKKLRAAP